MISNWGEALKAYDKLIVPLLTEKPIEIPGQLTIDDELAGDCE